jgi:hypothetical protein
MLRSIAVAAAVAALGLAFVATDADARSRGGFTGARVGGPSFRAAAPAFRGNFVNQGFRGPQVFRSVNPGVRFANPGFRRVGPGFRRFGYVGLPLVGAYGAYSYYNNQCVVPRNVLTQWGYRTQWINVCDEDYLY